MLVYTTFNETGVLRGAGYENKIAISLMLSIFAIPALAGNVHIKNGNNKDLIVYIQAEGSVSEDLHWMEFTMPANGMRDITITDKDMGGKATFISKENKPSNAERNLL